MILESIVDGAKANSHVFSISIIKAKHLDRELDSHNTGIYRAHVHLNPLRLVFAIVLEWCCNNV
jgi:hypothetical protein